jgi:hypothetical protein
LGSISPFAVSKNSRRSMATKWSVTKRVCYEMVCGLSPSLRGGGLPGPDNGGQSGSFSGCSCPKSTTRRPRKGSSSHEMVYGRPPSLRGRGLPGPGYGGQSGSSRDSSAGWFRVPTRMLKKKMSRGHDSPEPLTELTRLYLSDAQAGVPFFNAGKGPSALCLKCRFRH